MSVSLVFVLSGSSLRRRSGFLFSTTKGRAHKTVVAGCSVFFVFILIYPLFLAQLLQCHSCRFEHGHALGSVGLQGKLGDGISSLINTVSWSSRLELQLTQGRNLWHDGRIFEWAGLGILIIAVQVLKCRGGWFCCC